MTAKPDLDNQTWIEGLRAGRPEVAAALAHRLRAGLTRAFAGSNGPMRSDIEDFAQEATVRILERLSAFRGDSAFLTWAMAIGIRVSMTRLRRDKRVAPASRLEAIPSSSKSAASQDEHAELLAVLADAIDKDLTPRQRETLLAELDGVPQVTLAERLGVQPNALYKMTHDARKKLKAAIERAGFDANSVRRLLARA
ncbi:MAG: sigma-70 family RNA polymerase sigma factor [Phycisphaerales bacterium]|nr:sigma-70 family RNA polymerase sigma factor [Phycisphaerales bacterium]